MKHLKKIALILCTLLLLSPLSLSVLAAGDTVQALHITSVSAPLAGKTGSSVSVSDISLRVVENRGTDLVPDLVPFKLDNNKYSVATVWLKSNAPATPSTGGGTTTEPSEPSTGGGTTTEPSEPSTGGGTTTEPSEPSTGGGTSTEPTEPTTGGGTTTEPLNLAVLPATMTQEQTQTAEAEDLWIPMAAGETFEEGREYRLQITITLADPKYQLTEDTRLTLNGKTVTATQTATGEIVLEKDFVALPADLTPSAAPIEAPLITTKEYDTQAIELKVSLSEKKSGVRYRFDWYRNGNLVSSTDEGVLSLSNAGDSGDYHCVVVAFPEEEGTSPIQTFSTTVTGEVSVQITPIPVTLTFDQLTKDLFQSDPEFTYLLDREVFHTLEGEAERTEGEDVGVYEITLGTLAFPEDVAQNYVITVVPGTLTVNAIEDIPFSELENVADLSYIMGANGSYVRVIISKNALPEKSTLSLAVPTVDVRNHLKNQSANALMKSFTVTLTDEEGALITTLPSHAVLRFMIPLTEAEATQKVETITAKSYSSGTVSDLSTQITVLGGVTYITVETKTLGSIALYEGEAQEAPPPVTDPVEPPVTTPPVTTPPETVPVTTPPATQSPATGGPVSSVPGEQDSDSSILWILLLILLLLALGIVIYTEVISRKKKPPMKESERPVSLHRKESLQDELDSVFLVSEEEKERNHKTAKKLNQLPPIPEKKPMKKKPSPNGKPASTGKPGTAAPRPKTASTAGATGVKKPTRPKTAGAENRPASKNGTGVKKAPPRKVISFEDLEES